MSLQEDPMFAADVWGMANQPNGERVIAKTAAAVALVEALLVGLVDAAERDPAAAAEMLSIHSLEQFKGARDIMRVLAVMFLASDDIVRQGR